MGSISVLINVLWTIEGGDPGETVEGLTSRDKGKGV